MSVFFVVLLKVSRVKIKNSFFNVNYFTYICIIMSEKQYIAYYRVSTNKQGIDGLGLSSQKQRVSQFLKGDGVLVGEYEEVESGRNNNRTELFKAINHCKVNGAVLLIAKLDRLSRSVSFIYQLKDSGVKFVAADMPDANDLTIGLLAVMAENEAKRTSDRTIEALKEIKRKILSGEQHISKKGNKVLKLGKPDNLSHDDRIKGAAVMKQKALNNEVNKRAGAFVVMMRDTNNSFAKIASALNENGFKTVNGCKYSSMQTKRLYEMFK